MSRGSGGGGCPEGYADNSLGFINSVNINMPNMLHVIMVI